MPAPHMTMIRLAAPALISAATPARSNDGSAGGLACAGQHHRAERLQGHGRRGLTAARKPGGCPTSCCSSTMQARRLRPEAGKPATTTSPCANRSRRRRTSCTSESSLTDSTAFRRATISARSGSDSWRSGMDGYERGEGGEDGGGRWTPHAWRRHGGSCQPTADPPRTELLAYPAPLTSPRSSSSSDEEA